MPGVRLSKIEQAYLERPGAGGTVVLVHGFPDAADTWQAIFDAPEVRGARLLAPYLRGFGPTRFVDPATPRSGQIAALARDLVEFLEALDVRDCVLVGHDWGARAVYGAAVLAPERLRYVIALSVGHGTSHPGQQFADYDQAAHYWYQWFFATSRGEAALRGDRRALCKALWRMWSPNWAFTEAEFEKTAVAFDNPDFVEISLHSYRHRWGFAPGDNAYDADEDLLARVPQIGVPAEVLYGSADGATLRQTVEGRDAGFAAGYRFTTLEGVGHFPQRERPQAVIAAIAAALDARKPA